MITETAQKGFNISRKREQNHKFFDLYWSYKRCFWDHFPYDILDKIMYIQKPSKDDKSTFNDCIIMADTETSKKPKGEHNHICAWSICIRAYDQNIVTLWGRKPSEFIECLKLLQEHFRGTHTIIYFHNMGYDYTFLRRYLTEAFGIPVKQLNIKPYLPIYIEYENGIILRDSLILSGCSLEKWTSELNVDHQKAVGKWDYKKIRDQKCLFSPDEMLYIENDVVGGVECIDKLKAALGKKIYNMPWTMTGIVRESLYHAGVEHNAHKEFLKVAPTFDQLMKLRKVYHGGFTHGNRHYYGYVIRTKDGWKQVEAYDFASSYPYCLLSEKYPAEAFKPEDNLSIDEILDSAEEYAYMFKLILVKPELISDKLPMPTISLSKCERVINPVVDNGRIIQADYIEIYSNEIDLQLYHETYRYSKALSCCVEVEYAKKDYLPRWITDYVYHLFKEKSMLKSSKADKIYYNLAKSRLNSIYGLFVQFPAKEDIVEEYFYTEDKDLYHITDESKDEEFMRQKYEKFLQNRKSILPYFTGVWCTSYAMKNLFRLASCIDFRNGGEWLYSDTDSIYCTGMDQEKLAAYNEHIKKILIARGYPAVTIPGDDHEYWLGIAEHDPEEDEYDEFCFVGAKRYVGRCKKDGKLHTTVAGVPKLGHGKEDNDQFMDNKGNVLIGAKCLNDDIDNFKTGFIFKGILTGKKTHKYFLVPEAYIDEWGNETGDSIDLSPCDYKLKAAEDPDWDPFAPEEIEVQMYDDDMGGWFDE